MRKRGAAWRPLRSTSQPYLASRAWRGREACHVRHLRPSDYCKAGGCWQVKQLLQPTATYLFNHPFRGTAGMYRRILIPCRREPVRRKRGGHRPANDPAEEATACASQHAAGNIGDEFINYLNRVNTIVDEWARQTPAQLSKRRCSNNRCLDEGFQIRAGVCQGALKHRAIR